MFGVSSADRARAVSEVAKRERVRTRARAKTRAALRRELRRNPKAVLTRSFLKRANHVNFKLPLTVRLRAGAALEVTFLSIRRPLSTLTYPPPAGTQTLPLSGQFAMEMDF